MKVVNGILAVEDIARRLHQAAGDIGVRRAGVRIRGDHDLNPDLVANPPLVPAAVLVPIVEREGGPTILLTRRTAHLHAHAGQISFPGGRVEHGDTDPADCALRETEEEVGLPRDRTEIVGRLDTYQTRTGFEIVPVVGIVRPPFTVQPDSFEVAEVFEVPLQFVLDPANHQRKSLADRGGVERQFWVLPYGEYYIWGATAGMLVNLSEVLR